MAYYYKVPLDPVYVDLDNIMNVLTNTQPAPLMDQLNYYFGEGGIAFIVDTLQSQIDNIKARQPSETPPFGSRC